MNESHDWQNGLVRRLIPVAIGLSVLLWATAARTPSVPRDDIKTMSDIAVCLLADGSHAPSDADDEWRAQHHTIAAVAQSLWKSALVHADLAATRSPLSFETARAISSPDPPVRSTPHYLRHTPLLI